MLSLMLTFMSPVALDSFDEMIQRDHSSESASTVPYGSIVCFCSIFTNWSLEGLKTSGTKLEATCCPMVNFSLLNVNKRRAIEQKY